MENQKNLGFFTFIRFFISDTMFTFEATSISWINILKYLVFITAFGYWFHFSKLFMAEEYAKLDKISRISNFEIELKHLDQIEASVPVHVIMYFNKKNLDENTEKYMKANTNANQLIKERACDFEFE